MSQAPGFQAFYEAHVEEGFTGVVALNAISELSDLDLWAEEFGATHPLLSDIDREVWDQYAGPGGRPQYIVLDRDMTIMFKGAGISDHSAADAVVLDLL